MPLEQLTIAKIEADRPNDNTCKIFMETPESRGHYTVRHKVVNSLQPFKGPSPAQNAVWREYSGKYSGGEPIDHQKWALKAH
jgi:hypothetical protein